MMLRCSVHHVVVLEHLLADLEVVVLHLLLGPLDGVGDHAVFEGFALLPAQTIHEAPYPRAAEEAHQVVFHGQEELRGARVALAPRAAAQLQVDATRVVAFRAEDEETSRLEDLLLLFLALLLHLLQDRLPIGGAGLGDLAGEELGVAAEDDVRAAAGHVRGDGDGAEAARLGDDLRLLGVMLRVEHVAGHAPPLEAVGEELGLVDGDGAHQRRLARFVELGDGVHDGVELLVHRAVDHVVHVVPDHGRVGGDDEHVELVGLAELAALRGRRAGHARELLVEAEVVLEGHRGQGLVLPTGAHALLGLDGLVEAVRVASALHEATGELVDDDDLATLADVVLVPLEELLGLQGGRQVVDEVHVLRVVEIGDLDDLLGPGDALLRDVHHVGLLVDQVVVAILVGVDLALHLHRGELALPVEPSRHLGEAEVEVARLLGGTRDDEGGAGLVDEDGVHLVHDGVVQLAHDELLGGDGHVVAQVVEAELVVGPVGDVAAVGVVACREVVLELMDDEAHGEPHEAQDGAHPLRVASGEVVVHRDEVAALAREGVQVEGQGGGEGLAFARLHLGDPAAMEGHAAHELHVEVALPDDALGRLAAHGEGLGEQLVEGLARHEPTAELGSHLLEPGIAHDAITRFEIVDRVDDGHHLLELPVVPARDELAKKTEHGRFRLLGREGCARPATGPGRDSDGTRGATLALR